MLLVRPETPVGGSCKAKAFRTAGNLISSRYLAPDSGLDSRHLTIQLSKGETARGIPHSHVLPKALYKCLALHLVWSMSRTDGMKSQLCKVVLSPWLASFGRGGINHGFCFCGARSSFTFKAWRRDTVGTLGVRELHASCTLGVRGGCGREGALKGRPRYGVRYGGKVRSRHSAC